MEPSRRDAPQATVRTGAIAKRGTPIAGTDAVVSADPKTLTKPGTGIVRDPRSESTTDGEDAREKLKRAAKQRIELGVTGTPVFGGLILTDPNVEMQFPKNVAIYNKMRRSDGQVKAALLSLMLPIQSVEWTIEPYRKKDPSTGRFLEPDPADVEIAATMQKDLFEEMSTPWKHSLRQILSMLWAGFSIFEKVFEIGDDGLAHLRKLAPRLQETVFRWELERDGGLKNVIQRGHNPATGALEEITLPVEHIVVFVHDKEGADWTGMSILRSAYKHWFMKDWLYRIGVINAERGGGVPVIHLPDDANEADLEEAAKVGSSFHLHERAYVLEPPGWQFRLEATAGSKGTTLQEQIAHHNAMISANILAQFMDMVEAGGIGGRGMAGELVDLFLMALESVIFNVEDTMNRYLLVPWVDLNWRVEGYPRLKAQNIRGFNVRRMGVVLRTLVDGQMILPDEKLETFLREAMGLPEADLETRRGQQAQTVIGPDGQPMQVGPDGQPIATGPDGQPLDPNAPRDPWARKDDPTQKRDPWAKAEDKGLPGDNPEDDAPELSESFLLHEYSSVHVRMPDDLRAELADWTRRIPAEDLAGDGLETDPHVTVRYGLHTSALSDVRGKLPEGEHVRFTLGKVSRFAQPDHDVLYVSVRHAGQLRKLHRALGELPHEDTHPEYTPHLTLAYLKKGAAARWLGHRQFDGRFVQATSVWFSPRNGGGAPMEIPLAKPSTVELSARTNLDGPLALRRPPTEKERVLDVHDIDARTKQAAKGMLDKMRPIMKDQVAAMVLAMNDGLRNIRELRVPYVGAMASKIKSELHDVFEYGADQVRRELFRQADVKRARVSPGDAEKAQLVLADRDGRMAPWAADTAARYQTWASARDVELADPLHTKSGAFDFIGAKADLLSEKWANRLKEIAVIAKLRALRKAMNDADTAAEARQVLEEAGDKATKSMVLSTINDAFALGRQVEARRLKKSIQQGTYSALLDDHTCEVCEALDGTTAALDDPIIQTPNPDCKGERHGNSCRCIVVYQLIEGGGE